MIRFLFESDSSVSYTGPVIDNVCIEGGSVPKVAVQCQLLNCDCDGDGVRDVHVGEKMYYSATFINLTGDPVDYGAAHFFYAGQSCPDPSGPIDTLGPECKGTLDPYGIKTLYFAVHVPGTGHLVDLNPFCAEVAAWECNVGDPITETGRCCFDAILLPGWEDPPAPDFFKGFVVEEIDGPPTLTK